jgi:hypothetical protein
MVFFLAGVIDFVVRFVVRLLVVVRRRRRAMGKIPP